MFELSVPLTFLTYFFAKSSEGGILLCNYNFYNSLALVRVTVSFFNSFFCCPVKFFEIDHLYTHHRLGQGRWNGQRITTTTTKRCNDFTLFHAHKLALIIASIRCGSGLLIRLDTKNKIVVTPKKQTTQKYFNLIPLSSFLVTLMRKKRKN